MAQLALNALRSNMVTFTGTPGIEVNGVVIGYKAEYTERTSPEAKYNAIADLATTILTDNGQFYIQLGEQLYDGDLRLSDKAVDDFGRPSRRWEYDGKGIGTYAKTELIREEYTTEVTGKTLYEELGSEIIDSIKRGGANDYRLYVAIDGETTRNVLGTAYFTEGSMVRNNNNGVGDTGKGVLTQLFVDGVNKRVDIAIINTYLAQATKNYSSANDDVTLKVYKIDEKPAVGSGSYVKTANQTENFPVDGDDFDIKDVKKDDFFLVTVAQGEIQTMAKPEVLSEVTLNAFKVDSWVRSDGTQYDYASTAQYDAEVLEDFDANNMKDVTYNIFLDKYGYMVGLEQNEAANQYLFLTGLESGHSYLSATDAKANAIFLDGTMKTITVNMKKSMPVVSVSSTATSVEGGDWLNGNGTARKYSQLNTWCAYTVDDDGVYTLKEVGPDSGVGKDGPVKVRKAAQSAMDANPNPIKINTKNVTLDGNTGVDYAKVYGNDETVYINVKTAKITDKTPNKVKIVDDVDSVTTGIKNVDFTVNNVTDEGDYVAPGKEVYTLYKDNGYILAVVTLEAEDNGASASYAYIVGDVEKEEYLGGSKWKWYQDAIVDGKLVTLTETADTRACLNDTKKGLWYELSYNSDGEVASIKSNPALPNKSINFAVANDQYINRVSEVDNAVNGTGSYPADKTVLMYVDYKTAASANMRYENGTLWTNYTTKEGFWVSPNVKVVLCLSKGWDTGEFDKIYDTETYSGREGLVDALAALNSDKSAFHGYLSAIIEGKNGATTIILDDRSGVNLGNLEPVKPMTVTINRMGSDGKDLGAVTVLWNGGAAITDATLTTAGTAVNNGLDTLGYEDPTPGNKVASTAFVEDGKMTVTFTYEKGASLETKPSAVRVQFKAGGTGVNSPITVPITVDILGFGELTDKDVEKYVPGGYKLAAATGLPAAVTPTTGTTAIDVNVEKLPDTDITAIALADNTSFAWAKYGTAITNTSVKGNTVKFKLTYPNGDCIVDADYNTNAIVLADGDATNGTATWTKDGKATATINGKKCDLPVKIYADIAGVTAGTTLGTDWTVTTTATDTKAGKVTLTFTQTTASDFDAAAMAAFVATLGDNSTTNLTVGAFSNAQLTTAGVAATSTPAVFTVDLAISNPGANSVTILIESTPTP
ncbi:MAG: hypothetical protein HFF57_01140 [Lawsonibacter sp.]|nr:hypothetical protein [Lawsonibacter sp.]